MLGRWLLVLGPVVFGAATGYLTGQAGYDSDVLPAVLPVLVTGAGAAVVTYNLFNLGGNGRPSNIQTVIMVGGILFAGFLIAGAELGTKFRGEAALKARVEAHALGLGLLENERAAALQRRIETLRTCSRMQFLINVERKQVGQAPLPVESFCPTSFP